MDCLSEGTQLEQAPARLQREGDEHLSLARVKLFRCFAQGVELSARVKTLY